MSKAIEAAILSENGEKDRQLIRAEPRSFAFHFPELCRTDKIEHSLQPTLFS